MGVNDPRFVGHDIPTSAFADDDGAADPVLYEVLERFSDDPLTRGEVYRALIDARLLVPMVAVLEEVEVGADGLSREKSSSMATVSLIGAGGKRALLAFTSVEAMKMWDPTARQVASLAPDVCRTALDQGEDAVLLDVAGPVRFAITDEALTVLASLSTND